jgi:hypothetical protein
VVALRARRGSVSGFWFLVPDRHHSVAVQSNSTSIRLPVSCSCGSSVGSSENIGEKHRLPYRRGSVFEVNEKRGTRN